MSARFHVANFAPDTPHEVLIPIFEPYGTVVEIMQVVNRFTGEPRAAVHVQLEYKDSEAESTETEQIIVDALTGYEIDGRPLYVSRTKPPKQFPILNDEERQQIHQVAQTLGETESQPRSQIRRLVQICGMVFVNLLLEETLAIEADGGLLIRDGSRRRTVGGIFFHQGRQRLSSRMQRMVFYRPKPATPKPAEGEAQPAPKPAKQASPAKAGKPANEATGKPQLTGKPKKAEKGGKAPKDLPIPKKPPQKPQAAPQPASDPVALASARQEFAELRQAYAEAQRQLESLKTLPANDRKSGLFSATREVVNLQKQMAALLKQYPELND